MTVIDAVILGAVQGLTEFLPISSSGHLVLFQNLLGFKEPMLVFDIVVHWGTLLAVLCYFGRDFFLIVQQTLVCLMKIRAFPSKEELFEKYPYALIGAFVIVATLPTVLIALFFEDVFEFFFHYLPAVGGAWFLIGIFLIFSRRFQGGDRELKTVNHMDAFAIGTAQGLAIIPGISRSGITILLGMLCGFRREDAARFSFLISIPAILGAGILKFGEGAELAKVSMVPLAVGFVTSALVGGVAIALLMKLIQTGKFHLFGYYCLFASAAAFAVTFLQ